MCNYIITTFIIYYSHRCCKNNKKLCVQFYASVRCVLFEFEFPAKYRRLKFKSTLNFKDGTKVSCRLRHCSAAITVPVLELCLSCEHVPIQTKCQSYGESLFPCKSVLYFNLYIVNFDLLKCSFLIFENIQINVSSKDNLKFMLVLSVRWRQSVV